MASTGCQSGPVNPSFSISLADARQALCEMREQPRELERPVIVAGGYLDPHLGPWWVGRQFRKHTGDDRFLAVNFYFCGSMESCRKKLIAAVDEAFPSDDPVWTTEVDVIGVSMGGLVARYAALPPGAVTGGEGEAQVGADGREAADDPGAGDGDDRDGATGERRLKIRRLFTMSSPHSGATLAFLPCFLKLHRQMRRDSEFISGVNEATSAVDYELYPYVRLGDLIVGAHNAAPPDRPPYWVSNPLFHLAHFGGAYDARIHADIARRLRGEEAYSTRPPAPLP